MTTVQPLDILVISGLDWETPQLCPTGEVISEKKWLLWKWSWHIQDHLTHSSTPIGQRQLNVLLLTLGHLRQFIAGEKCLHVMSLWGLAAPSTRWFPTRTPSTCLAGTMARACWTTSCGLTLRRRAGDEPSPDLKIHLQHHGLNLWDKMIIPRLAYFVYRYHHSAVVHECSMYIFGGEYKL